MGSVGTAEIGRTGLEVARLGLGGAALGGLYTDVSEDVARETIRRAFQLGARYFDTAPLYGHGKSESYFGSGLAGLPRDRFVISTKVGRVLDPLDSARDGGGFVNTASFQPRFDFSRDGVLRSLEESLQRLNLDRVDVALIHDPDEGRSVTESEDADTVHFEQAMDETYPTLDGLRSQGVVKAIGVGMNQWPALVRFARAGDFDCFLLAGRYTLLDQSALPELLPLCQEKNISVMIGGPYNSGILASDLAPGAAYFYSDAPPEVLERARRIKGACDRHQVPLKAVALQFGLAHPAVASTIPGARSPAEIEENVRMAEHPIPDALWAELRQEGFLPDDAPTPSGG